MVDYLKKILGKNEQSVVFHGHKSIEKTYKYYQNTYLVVIPTFL